MAKGQAKKTLKVINTPQIKKDIRRSKRIKNGEKMKAIRKNVPRLKSKLKRKNVALKLKRKRLLLPKIKEPAFEKAKLIQKPKSKLVVKVKDIKIANPIVNEKKTTKSTNSQTKSRSRSKKNKNKKSSSIINKDQNQNQVIKDRSKSKISSKSKSKLKIKNKNKRSKSKPAKQIKIAIITNEKRQRKPSKYFQMLLQKSSLENLTTQKKAVRKINEKKSEIITESKTQDGQFIRNPIKTISELQRIKRSQNQRIFLIAAERRQQQWGFKVMGTKGSLYQVIISTKVKCNCIDFRTHRKPCKHIYFIVTQVAKKNQILDQFQLKTQIQTSTYKKLDEYLVQNLRRFIEKQGDLKMEDINLKDDKDCAICFCEMEIVIQKLERCIVCKKYFHQQCLTAWKKVNNSCPLCRSVFQKKAVDSLQRLEEVII